MLREMDHVYAVYLERSFSRAAEKLYISQPALSATIKKVENQIGTPIFDRSTSPISLTPAGEFYIQSIEKIKEIKNEMLEYFNQVSESKKGRLTFGSSSFFCIYVLPGVVKEFQREYPNMTVEFVEGSAQDLSEKLRNGLIDFALDVQQLDRGVFNSMTWGYENILLAVSSSHPANKNLEKYRLTFEEVRTGAFLDKNKKGVDAGDFADAPFLLLKKGNDIHSRAMAICKKSGFTPAVSMYPDQLLTCYYLACEGKGATFIRDSIVRYVDETDKICLYKVDGELSPREIMLFFRKKPPALSPLAKKFLDFVRSKAL